MEITLLSLCSLNSNWLNSKEFYLVLLFELSGEVYTWTRFLRWTAVGMGSIFSSGRRYRPKEAGSVLFQETGWLYMATPGCFEAPHIKWRVEVFTRRTLIFISFLRHSIIIIASLRKSFKSYGQHTHVFVLSIFFLKQVDGTVLAAWYNERIQSVANRSICRH